MKNINRLLTLLIIFGFSLTGCETEIDDPTGDRNVIEATPVIENLDPSIFLAADLENTYVAFDVTAGDGGQTMDAILEVSYDGGMERAQLDGFTIPATGLEVSLADVAAAIGVATSSFEGGKYVNIEVLTKAGDKYYRSSTSVNPLIACNYVSDDYPGTPNGESAGWGVSGPLTVTIDPADATGYTLLVAGFATMDGCVEDGGPLPLIIDPASYNITVPRTVLASVISWHPGNSDIWYEGTGSLNTCTRDMVLDLTIGATPYGTYGTYRFYISY